MHGWVQEIANYVSKFDVHSTHRLPTFCLLVELPNVHVFYGEQDESARVLHQ